MKPVILEAAGDGEIPPLRWRTFRTRMRVDDAAYGFMVHRGPEWAVLLCLGRWLLGIECTREED